MPTKQEVAATKNALEIDKMKRAAKLGAWNDYIGFGISKAAGVSGLVLGGISIIDPNLLHLTILHPEVWAGSGFALLTGNSAIALLRKAAALWVRTTP
jgi:hypothetical protein